MDVFVNHFALLNVFLIVGYGLFRKEKAKCPEGISLELGALVVRSWPPQKFPLSCI